MESASKFAMFDIPSLSFCYPVLYNSDHVWDDFHFHEYLFICLQLNSVYANIKLQLIFLWFVIYIPILLDLLCQSCGPSWKVYSPRINYCSYCITIIIYPPVELRRHIWKATAIERKFDSEKCDYDCLHKCAEMWSSGTSFSLCYCQVNPKLIE